MEVGACALGDFLRARREQVRPEDVGLVPGARRRVPGLRREELAMLAGISSEYYLRLEQGRDKNPSPQILDALARALQLDIKARRHLHQLAGPPVSHWDDTALEEVADGLDELIDSFPFPALVASRCQDVLAANLMACALSPGFRPGQNFLRWRLLDPAAREFYVNWDEATEVAVGGLRELAGIDPDDPRIRSLIVELSTASPRFRELWARADVGYRRGIVHMRHPQVGELFLRRHQLNLPHGWGIDGQHVIIYHPEPDSDSEKAIERLASLSGVACGG